MEVKVYIIIIVGSCGGVFAKRLGSAAATANTGCLRSVRACQIPPEQPHRLEAAASPAGAKVDFVSRRGSKTGLSNPPSVQCFWPQKIKDEAPTGGFPTSKIPWFFKWLRVFCNWPLDPLKNTSLLPSEMQKTR